MKKEVQDELKKQEQNPTSVNPFAEYEKKIADGDIVVPGTLDELKDFKPAN